MYDQIYVKKHKRKKAAAFITGISTVGITALSIVAFLGRFVGTFSITLRESNVKLALSATPDFEESTSYMHVEQLPTFEEYTYSSIKKREAEIDSDETDYFYGGNYDEVREEVSTLNYFKFTFYIKNVGVKPARYVLSVNITDSAANEAGRSLEDTLRVAVYHNAFDSDEHQSTVFAKRSPVVNTDENGEVTFKEAISTPLDKASSVNPFYGFAEEFETDTRVGTIEYEHFYANEINRVTFVSWLEGADPQSDERLGAPKGAKLKLGVEINAYED